MSKRTIILRCFAVRENLRVIFIPGIERSECLERESSGACYGFKS